jgi:ABC-type Fe3+/spermidine/putrescine transport system ATPase subunit
MAGLQPASAGTVTFEGRPVAGEVPDGIGVVFQEDASFPWLTVWDNTAFGLRRSGVDDAETRRRVDDVLAFMGLKDFARAYPAQLSGGMRQRVCIARTLVLQPRLILLDEPFAALDASLRDSLRAEIKQLLASLGTTVVLVTHDQEEALSLADLVAILADGRIVQHAAPRAIYQQPKTLEVAHFLGDTNLVDARFEGDIASTPLGELPVEPRFQRDGDGLVLIRPEQILLTRLLNGHRPPLSARVTAVTYFGHDAIARLSLETRTGTLELIARTRGDLAPPVDTHVALAFDGTMRAYDDPRL